MGDFIFLARLVTMPKGLYILPSVISFFSIEQNYLRIYWTDFHDFFSPNGRYLCECFKSSPVFPIPRGTLPWQPILCCSALVHSEPKYLRIRWTRCSLIIAAVNIPISVRMLHGISEWQHDECRCIGRFSPNAGT